MIKINKANSLAVNCRECGEMVGPFAPAIELSYGFITNDEFNVYDNIILHYDCLSNHSLDILIKEIEDK